MADYTHLFTPIDLRHKTLKNRIVFGAHTSNMSADGTPGDRHFGYYRERARGGAAMIVSEPSPAHRTGVLIRANFLHDDDAVIPHFRRITDECHSHGTVMMHQIYHVGGHGDQDNSWEPYWSPSGKPSMHDPWGSHAVTEAEIEELIEGFVQAARRDRDAGFDGVDIFAGYNCLVDQFWSPITNRRDDRWGGSLENRLRFSVEICSRIRNMAGDDFIIGMTVSGAEPYPGGLSLADKQEIIAYLDERGLVDYYSVGSGSYLNQFSKIVPSFHYGLTLTKDDAAAYKEITKHALVTSEARIKAPYFAEQIIAEGKADMVSLVRSQIADPHLANKAAAGNSGDIRPCISCNQFCIGRRLRENWISCVVNPSVGREYEWNGDSSPDAEAPRQILVVGGGPAGLEAARVTAARGHKVRLVEKTGELGGQFRLAGGQPERGEINYFLNWCIKQLEELQVQVDLRTELSAEDIEASGADAVVLCTGSTPSRDGYQRTLPHVDKLPGADQDNVCTIHDVLEGTVTPGTNVLLLDGINGWWPASGTALYLAEQRHNVTLVTGSEMAAGQLENSRTADTTRERFMKMGVETVLATAVTKWEGNTATFLNLYTGDEETREFDSLVMACTNNAANSLQEELSDSAMEIHAVGDTVSARTAGMAIYEGRKLGLKL
ncbi:MAG: FAD-dependent oxidoreductase [Pseudomonadota bacterium]|nr:FAD-dependent oxidoreductase [Pseudomonadota bacterium]